MKRKASSLGVHLLVCAALVAAERFAAHLLAADDLVAQLLVEHSGSWLALLISLMVLRLTVLFVLPGWLAWVTLAATLGWRRAGLERVPNRKPPG